MDQPWRSCRRYAWLLVAVLWAPPQPGQADPFLGRLDCVSLQVNVLESGESFGVTSELLRDAARTGLKKLAPTLSLEPSCPDQVSLKVFIQSVTSGTAQQFFGHALLEVRRKAIFRDTALLASTRAWDLESYLYGPRAQAKTVVLKHLNRLLAQFAEDYGAANKREAR